MSAFTITSDDPIPAAAPVSKPKPERRSRALNRSAKYDAADTGPENRQHWAAADYLSANATNSVTVRGILKSRSRYEVANNGYAKGLIKNRTNDTIGTGPRLQLDFPEETYDPDFQRTVQVGNPEEPKKTPADLAHEVEKKWCEWCEEIGLADKLRVLADAEDVDGEAFALFKSRDTDYPVQLTIKLIESDRVETPDLLMPVENKISGISFNDADEPVSYDILKQHPGDSHLLFSMPWDYITASAAEVIHLFDPDRPEQKRGIPILTPALPLYAILRRYTLASLGAAEIGAMIAGVIENPNATTDGSTDEAPEFEAMDAVPFARNALLTMPGGATAKKFDSNTPTADHGTFKREVLTEAGRSAGEMRNTATGSSEEYNYSSGRLDHLPRQRGIEIRRCRWERQILDRVFAMWYSEALRIPDYLPAGLPAPEEWYWCWQWDGFPSIDPKKDADAEEVDKRNGMLTDSVALARRGIDWREHYKQLAREKAMRTELGIEPKPPPAPAPAKAPIKDGPGEYDDPDEEDEEDDEEEEEAARETKKKTKGRKAANG